MSQSSRRYSLFALVIFAIALTNPFSTEIQAAEHRIKLTTIAPKGSSFHRSLQRMGQAWKDASGGTVELIIYPGGIQGGEAAMVDRMRIKQIQAALLTTAGLSEIEPATSGLQFMPMMFRTLDEVEFVSEKLQPMLEKRLREKGFIALFWADMGWVRFFSKTQVATPDELRKTKLFTWAGSTATSDTFREAGFTVVPLEPGDILTSLQTGLIDSVPMPPSIALASQVYTPAPHMLELNWSPMVGALVISKKVWEEIPFRIRMEMVKSARLAGKEIKASGRLESDESVKTMQKKWGLKVQPVSPELEAIWRHEAENIYDFLRGRMVPEDIFDEVQLQLKDYRQGKSAARQ